MENVLKWCLILVYVVIVLAICGRIWYLYHRSPWGHRPLNPLRMCLKLGSKPWDALEINVSEALRSLACWSFFIFSWTVIACCVEAMSVKEKVCWFGFLFLLTTWTIFCNVRKEIKS